MSSQLNGLIEAAKEAEGHGDFNEAIKHYSAAIKLAKTPEILNSLALAYYNTGKYKKALVILNDILSNHNKDFFAAIVNLANCYARLGDIKEALRLYSQAEILEPNNFLPSFCKGVVYSEMKNYSSAEVELKRAFEKKRDEYVILLELARIHFRQSNYGRAIYYSKKVLSLRPEHVESIIILAISHYKQSNIKMAIVYQEKALALQPQDRSINEFMGRLYFEVGNEQKAKECFEKAKKMKK